jgi:hypothetical protein
MYKHLLEKITVKLGASLSRKIFGLAILNELGSLPQDLSVIFL